MIEFLLALSLQATPDEHWNAKCGGNTRELNQCYAEAVERSQRRLDLYIRQTKEFLSSKNGKDYDAAARAIQGLEQSQRAFEAYRDIQCEAVFADAAKYSMRTIIFLTCKVSLTDKRAEAIWDVYLRPPSGDPILPKPESTIADDLRSPAMPDFIPDPWGTGEE